MQRIGATENVPRPILWMDVQERSDAGQRVFDAFENQRRSFVGIVLAAHRQTDAASGRHDDAGRPNLDIELHRLAWPQRPGFVMGVIRPIGQAAQGIDLPMRRTQPSIGDRRARIVRTDEGNLPARLVEDAQHQKDIGIGGRRREKQLGRDRSGDLQRFRQRRREETLAVAERLVAQGCLALRVVPHQAHGLRVEIEFGPLRARQRPFAFVPLDERLAGVTDLQLHARLLVPAGVLALEEVAKKALLQADSVVRVEVRPVRIAMHLKPLLPGGGSHEAFEVPARMQSLSTPIRRAEHRQVDPAEVGRPLAARIVVERVIENELLDVEAVLLQLLVAQCGRSGHEFARHPAPQPALAEPVLHSVKGPRKEIFEEPAVDATVAHEFPVPIGGAFPHANGGQMRRLVLGDVPLV